MYSDIHPPMLNNKKMLGGGFCLSLIMATKSDNEDSDRKWSLGSHTRIVFQEMFYRPTCK